MIWEEEEEKEKEEDQKFTNRPTHVILDGTLCHLYRSSMKDSLKKKGPTARAQVAQLLAFYVQVRGRIMHTHADTTYTPIVV